MVRPLITLGAPVLQQRATCVGAITPAVRVLIDDMIETMYAAAGVGLAAPQVAVPLRIFVADVSSARDGRAVITMVDPEIVNRDGVQLEEEGCLSVPGVNATVLRPRHIVVRGRDHQGQMQELTGTGLLARAFQHELDHLDGRLFVDHLRRIHRALLLRRFRRQQTKRDAR